MGCCWSKTQKENQIEYLPIAHTLRELRTITEVSQETETDSGYEAGTEMEPLSI